MPTADSSSILPIEIGTFDAFQPEKSEFIGSSSGVFFVNTVFRAFAKSYPDTTDGPGNRQNTDLLRTPPANDFSDNPEATQVVVDGHLSTGENGLATTFSANSMAKTYTYNISVEGLGDAPTPVLAKELIMLYFRHWHPFSPFIHGPTFFDGISSFYDGTANQSENGHQGHDQHTKLCRAVTYQCVFNLAASAHTESLATSCRIQKPSVLTDLLGVLSGSHDIASLQALMAAELYLASLMALRAASTVHGVLTRLIFHSGLHRCPFRYIQLPSEVREMRKRILWSAYCLDRYLSQSLGHPLGLQDSDIDVCIPSGDEMHTSITTTPGQAEFEDVQNHMPHCNVRTKIPAVVDVAATLSQPHGDVLAVSSSPATSTDWQSSHNGQKAALLLQGCFVTHSQLVAEALELFHKSLHARLTTQEKVTELTYKINSWWNGLPAPFQDEVEDSSELPGTSLSYSAFFTISYHHLILIINRPLLSLRTDTMDFRSSLQKAISASRGIVAKLRHVVNDPFLMTWPIMLSAAWMSGLVLAFATLLDMYPLPKATL